MRVEHNALTHNNKKNENRPRKWLPRLGFGRKLVKIELRGATDPILQVPKPEAPKPKLVWKNVRKHFSVNFEKPPQKITKIK